MRKVEVCLSPELSGVHPVAGKVAVVVDILRATSCMVSGIGCGVTEIVPFSDVEACRVMAVCCAGA